MAKPPKIKKDKFVDNLLASRWFYLAIFPFIVIYFYLNRSILHFSIELFCITMGVSLLILTAFFYWRYFNYKEYYKWLLIEYGVFWISVGYLLIVVAFRFFVMIPFQLLIIKTSDSNETHYVSCKITNIDTRKRLIYYDFMGNTTRFHYDFAIDTPYTFKRNYAVEISVRKSLWDTYLVSSEKLVHN